MPIAGWAPLYSTVPNSYDLKVNKSPLIRRMQRILRKDQLRSLQALMLSLNGAAPGATATKTFKEVDMQADGLLRGGLRTINTKTSINRASTAGDKTTIDDVISHIFTPTRVADLSGNWTPLS